MIEGPVMPASLYPDMEKSSSLEDQRALQLALELSMLGLNGSGSSTDGSSSPEGIVDTLITAPEETRTKKSQNMTECVPVPSSEHVAEIVGRQGCKIKALRAKTNTYIKTPVRGEEPVFVVTGRKEDVAAAKKEILSAADHFSQIRAQRKGGGSPTNGVGMPPGPPHLPGQITRPVRVPYKVVGLVVGPKGATIKRIQQQTHTYIVTPSRDREPVFEVTGLPENVELAKKEIENHIAFRTGNLGEEDYVPNGGSNGMNGTHRPTPLLNGFSGLESAFPQNDGNSSCSSSASSSTGSTSFLDNLTGFYPQKVGEFPNPNNGYTCLFQDDAAHAIWSADAETNSTTKNGWEFPNYSNGSTTNGTVTRGLQAILGSIGSRSTTNGRISPLDSHPPARRFHSDPLGNGLILGGSSDHSSHDSVGSPSPPLSTQQAVNGLVTKRNNCMVCFDSPVIAALIPCGHNLFCMECAQRMCKSKDTCPVCQQQAIQAIRIISQPNV